MFGAPTSNPLNMGRLIWGISKTLNFANQVIPIYEQAKPMISNARKMMAVLKEFSSTPLSTNNSSPKITSNQTKNTNLNASIKPTSNPVFFQ